MRCVRLFGLACALPNLKLHTPSLQGGLRIDEDIGIDIDHDRRDPDGQDSGGPIPNGLVEGLQKFNYTEIIGQHVVAWVNGEEKRIVLGKQIGNGHGGAVYTDGRFAIKVDKREYPHWSENSHRLSHQCAMLNRAAAAGVRVPLCYSRYEDPLRHEVPLQKDVGDGQSTGAPKLGRYLWGQMLNSTVNMTYGNITAFREALVMDMVPGKQLFQVTASEWQTLRREERLRVLDGIVSNAIRMLSAGLTNLDGNNENIMVDLATQNITFIDFATANTDEERLADCRSNCSLPVGKMLREIFDEMCKSLPFRKELPTVLATHGAEIKALDRAKRTEFRAYCDHARGCLEAVGGQEAV